MSIIKSCLMAIFQRTRNYSMDFAALGLIVAFSPIIYVYGIFYLIPDVFKESCLINKAIAYAFATWCVFGILGHLYLVRHRKSSIQGRFLPQPLLATSSDFDGNGGHNPSLFEAAAGLHHRRTQDINKTLGQQFVAKPFGSDEAWHICSKCEVYVPNGCWHCSKGCNTCILRRDHHCVFAMACIGEENHSNFLGLVMYLCIGCAYAIVLLMIYSCNNLGVTYGWFLFKAFIPAIFLFTDFSPHYFMCSLCLLGSILAGAVFFVYFLSATKGQTSAARKYSVAAHTSLHGASYRNLEAFLGSNPLWRIIWPFHTIYKTDYNHQRTS